MCDNNYINDGIKVLIAFFILMAIIFSVTFIFEYAKQVQKDFFNLEMKKLEVEKARITSELADKYLTTRPTTCPGDN